MVPFLAELLLLILPPFSEAPFLFPPNICQVEFPSYSGLVVDLVIHLVCGFHNWLASRIVRSFVWDLMRQLRHNYVFCRKFDAWVGRCRCATGVWRKFFGGLAAGVLRCPYVGCGVFNALVSPSSISDLISTCSNLSVTLSSSAWKLCRCTSIASIFACENFPPQIPGSLSVSWLPLWFWSPQRPPLSLALPSTACPHCG